ncbi:iron-sulfur cluster biosynthesis family protein [Lapidilactobacillus bayanensis]|uniref:iron-sulfur cluster biosynthesis family protein n=1 Tax=Lapidilactobacillus bayanensis TaxID=2485998 RepID=UPI000F79BA57|nr:iron-sulfur cluster biosynthesis family protein [Lapidilactobacillus bayanensis]
MEIKVKEAAETYLENKVTTDNVILLALNDGSNQFSNMGGTCSIGASFQFVIVDKMYAKYDVPIENNMGLKMFTSKDELAFLVDGLNVNYRNGFLSLADNSGIIDGAMTVNQYQPRTEAELKEQMETIGHKNC